MTEEDVRRIAIEEFFKMLNGTYELEVYPNGAIRVIDKTKENEPLKREKYARFPIRMDIGFIIGEMAVKHIKESRFK